MRGAVPLPSWGASTPTRVQSSSRSRSSVSRAAPLEPGAVAELDGDDVAGVPVSHAQQCLPPGRAAHHPGWYW